MTILGRLVKLKAFEAADAAALEVAFDAWKSGLNEEKIIPESVRMSDSGDRVVMTLLYTY